jgi:predicted alpha/beta hydrolase family esterase
MSENSWYLFPFYFIHDLYLILRNRLHYYFHLEPSKSWKTGNRGDVILIQGLNGRWVSLETIGREIHKWGYKVHIIKKLGNNLKPVAKGAADIAEYIKANDLKNVVLIGHSKGALNAIYVLKNLDIAKNIKIVITIASPFKGIKLCKFHPIARELEPESIFMKHYIKGIDPKKIINLYPSVDSLVIPNKSLEWNKVINKQIDVFGHIRVVESDQTISEIRAILLEQNGFSVKKFTDFKPG